MKKHEMIEQILRLKKERGGQYKFLSIGEVLGQELKDVELEHCEPSGKLKNLIKAKSCKICLIKRDRYVEFLFYQGYFETKEKTTGFYNDQYRLPIPNIDNDLWINSDLSFMEIK